MQIALRLGRSPLEVNVLSTSVDTTLAIGLVPLAYVLYVRPDAMAQIVGVKSSKAEANGSTTYEVVFLSNGLLHAYTDAISVNTKDKTWNDLPVILEVSETLAGFGFDAEDTERFIFGRVKRPGYRPENKTKRSRKVVGRR